MTQKHADKRHKNGGGPTRQVDPEVLPQAKRRTFTAAYKLWVLEEADKCREQPGQIGALLRREGLYSSHLTSWRRQREAGQMAGLKPQKRGRQADEEAAETSRLRRENERLTRQLVQAELIIEAQKKLSEILGITLEQRQDENKRRQR
jgi:transposase